MYFGTPWIGQACLPMSPRVPDRSRSCPSGTLSLASGRHQLPFCTVHLICLDGWLVCPGLCFRLAGKSCSQDIQTGCSSLLVGSLVK